MEKKTFYLIAIHNISKIYIQGWLSISDIVNIYRAYETDYIVYNMEWIRASISIATCVRKMSLLEEFPYL